MPMSCLRLAGSFSIHLTQGVIRGQDDDDKTRKLERGQVPGEYPSKRDRSKYRQETPRHGDLCRILGNDRDIYN